MILSIALSGRRGKRKRDNFSLPQRSSEFRRMRSRDQLSLKEKKKRGGRVKIDIYPHE